MQTIGFWFLLILSQDESIYLEGGLVQKLFLSRSVLDAKTEQLLAALLSVK